LEHLERVTSLVQPLFPEFIETQYCFLFARFYFQSAIPLTSKEHVQSSVIKCKQVLNFYIQHQALLKQSPKEFIFSVIVL